MLRLLTLVLRANRVSREKEEMKKCEKCESKGDDSSEKTEAALNSDLRSLNRPITARHDDAQLHHWRRSVTANSRK